LFLCCCLFYRCVVNVAQNGDHNGRNVEECGEYQEAIVVLAIAILELLDPRLVPRVHEVDEEYELNDDEQEAADEAEIHEDLLERAVSGYVEGADDEAHERQHLEEPKAVLNVGAWIARRTHVHHNHREQEEEAHESETNAIHGEITFRFDYFYLELNSFFLVTNFSIVCVN
jgi:hypothetical protein